MDPAIGLDLGTTFSCIGVYNNGKVEIIPNEQGNRITPSYVKYNNNKRFIGESAKFNTDYENVIFNAKRLIGRNFSDPIVQAEIKYFPFKLIQGDNDSILIEITENNTKKYITPIEVSSAIIYKMKQIAENYLNKEIKHMVITVPAYFNDSQRSATRDAARIAGINVLRIINEPTAASIAYGINDSSDKKYILVYDFGGGTFDTSILELEDGTFIVSSTTGDTHLGGEDIDNVLVDHCITEYNKSNINNQSNININTLKMKCEQAKRLLSHQNDVNIEITNNFTINLSRAKFNYLNLEIFRKTMEYVDKVLNTSKLNKKDISEIVLVGGSTRIPKVQQMIKEYFNKEPCTGIDPDESVAFGATIQAAMLLGYTHEQLDNKLLLDVTPLSLGVETTGNLMTILIPKNTSIPVKRTQTFSTFQDYQTGATIKVFEGERILTKDNNLLGIFNLSNIPAMPKGKPQIEITYEIDTNGILYVSAIEKNSKSSADIRINPDGTRLTKDKINELINDASKFKEYDQQQKLNIESKNILFNYCNSMISDSSINLTFLDSCNNTLQWLHNNPNLNHEFYDQQLKNLQNEFTYNLNNKSTDSDTVNSTPI